MALTEVGDCPARWSGASWDELSGTEITRLAPTPRGETEVCSFTSNSLYVKERIYPLDSPNWKHSRW